LFTVLKASSETVFSQLGADFTKTAVGSGEDSVVDSDTSENIRILIRFIDVTLNAFKRNGCMVDDETKRQQYVELLQNCARLESEFEQAINEDTTTIELTRQQLEGCTNAFLDSLFNSNSTESSSVAKSGTKKGVEITEVQDAKPEMAKISMKAPTRVPVMQFAKSAAIRRQVQHVANSRCVPDNEHRLHKLVDARMTKAKLLGYSSHAEQMLQDKMVGSLDAAKNFLLDIHNKLRPAAAQDLQALSRTKATCLLANQTGNSDIEDSALQVNSWDGAYYARLLKDDLFDMDSEKIREFFPMEHVKSAIFRVYQRLLGVRFKQVEREVAGRALWHEEVELFEVIDCDTGDLCGHFFLDLFARDGKFGHQCVVPVVPSCHRMVIQSPEIFEKSKGWQEQKLHSAEAVIPPACAILGNMTKATASRPSLLRFAEVQTFFHEFGHVMHAVLSRTIFTRFSWTWPMMPWPGGVEQDFLEVPSMFLEKLVFQPSILKELSHHFETGKQLDDDTVRKLNSAQHFLAGRSWSRFIGMAMYDLELHSQTRPYKYGTQNNFMNI
jgi:Zn-dependent oligopeptidase